VQAAGAGVHDFGRPIIGITRGSVIVAWNFDERPAAAELKPFLADVGHAPVLELLHRPVAGFLELSSIRSGAGHTGPSARTSSPSPGIY
jgi:hypothetical protein